MTVTPMGRLRPGGVVRMLGVMRLARISWHRYRLTTYYVAGCCLISLAVQRLSV